MNSPKSQKFFGDFFLTGKYTVGVLMCLLMATSCKQENKNEILLYNLDSLIDVQVKLLATQKASYKKTAQLDSRETSTSSQPVDTTAWNKELEIFTELSAVNNPVNKTQYNIESGIPDSKSNLLIKSASAKDESLPIRYLRVYYLPTPFQVKRIEGFMQKDKEFYKSARYFNMEFEEIKQQTTLKAYSILGGQKMLLRDSVTFSVHASITIP